jgi:hypothetical protein
LGKVIYLFSKPAPEKDDRRGGATVRKRRDSAFHELAADWSEFEQPPKSIGAGSERPEVRSLPIVPLALLAAAIAVYTIVGLHTYGAAHLAWPTVPSMSFLQ